MDKKISFIKERVLQIADYKGIGKEKFCEQIGMTYGNFKGQQKWTALNSDAIDKILSLYPEISAEWLVTGKGNIEKEKKEENIVSDQERSNYSRMEINYNATIEALHKVIAAQDKTIQALEMVIASKSEGKKNPTGSTVRIT